MQNRGLSGFLTPLGKLAGMFGWTPGKSAEHLNAVPARSQVASAIVNGGGHRLLDARQQLAQLARPANASAGDVLSLPANLRQIRPHQLTQNQLQNLQKAAELLSSRSTAPWQAQTHALPSMAQTGTPKPERSVATVPVQASFQQPGFRPTTSHRGDHQQERGLQACSPACIVSSPETADVECSIDVDTQLQTVPTMQDDDILAAALASNLASMAPQITSLYSDTLSELPVTSTNYMSAIRQQAPADCYKRKRDEAADQHSSHLSYAVPASMPNVERLISGTLELHSTGSIVNIGASTCPALSDDGQNMHNSSQLCHEKLSTQPRKKFKKTTGLEVLYRCMPPLWQSTSHVHS